MSQGAFSESIYTTDGGTAYTIRVQPETITTWNAAGTGTVAANTPSVQVSKGRRAIGINARIARFRWKTTVPDGYETGGIITLPILTKTAFDALAKKTDYTYQGSTLNLVGKSGETIR